MTCASCGTFRVEVGDLCWLCSHDATAHPFNDPCACAPEQVYPVRVRAALRGGTGEHAPGGEPAERVQAQSYGVDAVVPQPVEDHLLRR